MDHHTQHNLKLAHDAGHGAYKTLDIQYEEDYGLAWYITHPEPRPCVTEQLVQDINAWFDECERSEAYRDLRYLAVASSRQDVFNLGGDLELFCRLIRNGDRQGIFDYARACIDTLLRNYQGLNRDITTISLIQGDALGGGLEYALSSHVVIAEKGSKLGFPDVLFNLFPGVGAYSLISRRTGPKKAEEIIMSGRLYSADELHALGVVDVLAEAGHGEKAVYDYISSEERAPNGIRAFRQAKKCTQPLTREEMISVANIWADAAMRLRDRDLRMMERLVKRQSER